VYCVSCMCVCALCVSAVCVCVGGGVFICPNLHCIGGSYDKGWWISGSGG
jgi:hypothetical protein